MSLKENYSGMLANYVNGDQSGDYRLMVKSQKISPSETTRGDNASIGTLSVDYGVNYCDSYKGLDGIL